MAGILPGRPRLRHDRPVPPLLRSVLAAFGPVPLAFVATTTLLLVIALRAGLLGLALLAIVSSWVAKYAFVVLEAAAHGLPPPVLSIEMTNPLDERRPLYVLVIVATVAGLAALLRTRFGTAPAALLVGVALVLAPAAIAQLAVDGRLFRALDPLACLAVARGVGAAYAGVCAAAAALVAGVAWLAARAPGAATIAAAEFGLIAWALMFGHALHARRLELGLEAVAAPERARERVAAAADAEHARLVDEVYALVRARRPEEAWQLAWRRLAAGGPSVGELTAFLERASAWEDPRIADRLRRELVTRLLALGRPAEALAAVEDGWRRGRAWRPASPREAARLAQLALARPRAAGAQRLLAEATAEFPDDAELAALRRRVPPG
jgi:hypothetical protein